MRWEALFADMEARWDAEASAELERDIAEATRFEQAAVGLVDRLRAQIGAMVTVALPGERLVEMRLDAVGEDWIAGSEGHQGIVVPLQAVQSVEGLLRRAAHEHSHVRRRMGLSMVLRGMTRDRAVVEIRGAEGGVLVHGLLVNVGRDHCEVARTIAGEVPRLRRAQGVRTVPFAAMTEIRAEAHPPS
ncbi:hypothetical protein [Nesterenkonia sp. HG001]|uniref:hypothetical protein n=1 Tax=Nesterenkonia sp. HG001 TaxID=2983207 RepID=UPI002AC5ABB0|nr:hypothetical protein [Nesterenkonia sp. HG001]MDZ5076248.1 hypothetical protein [Nesterenkonia sp. HG001]